MKKLLLFLPLLLLISCAKFSLYSEKIKDFKDNRWAAGDVKTFSFELTEDVEKAQLDLFFSYVFEPGYDKVPVKVYMTKEGAEGETVMPEVLVLKNEAGENLGDCLGDVCDLTQNIATQNFTKGKYIIKVVNEVNGPYLPNVIALGISLETTE